MRSQVEAGSNDAANPLGSSRRARASLLIALVAALALAAIVSGASSAGAVVLPVETFGAPGSGASQLSKPGGIAADPTTGNLFVADTANERIDEFNAEGLFLRAWGWGVEDGTSALQTCTTECQAGQAGQGAGQLNEPVSVAVAPNGDVYALNRAKGDGRIQRFATGAAEVGVAGSFGGYGAGPGQLTYPLPIGNALAVGPSGEVLVADPTHGPPRIAIFSGAGTFESEIESPSGANSVAVDPTSGRIFVVGFGVSVFEPGGAPAVSFGIELSNVTGVAVDSSNGRVLVNSTTGFEASTQYVLTEFEEEVAGGTLVGYKKVGSAAVPGMTPPQSYSDPLSYGLAYDPVATYPRSEAGAFYLADRAGGKIHVLAEPEAGAPEASAIAASGVGTDGANLTAAIDPRGEDTHYFFRYGTTPAYGSTSPAAPGTDIGAGFTPRAVSTHLVGLTPGTTYHFQLVAENVLGTFESGDLVFTTSAPGSPQVLPDGRAWEQVSTEKGLNDVAAEGIADPAGNGASFTAVNGLPGSPSGILFTAYSAHRGPSGWKTEAASPPDVNLTSLAFGPPLLFSPDLEQTVATSNEALTANSPAGVANLYLRDNATGGEELMTPYAPKQPGFVSYSMTGASTDFGHIVFQSSSQLTPATPESATNSLYEFSGGGLRNIGILPGETKPNPTGVETSSGVRAPYPVSDDGSRVFFVATPPEEGGPAAAQLYMRTNDSSTIEISSSQRRPADPPAPVTFMGASADGSVAFFTSNGRLTEDAYTGSPPGGAPNLYRYDVTTGELTDLSVASDPADEQFGAIVGGVVISKSGNSAYFTARGDLAPEATSGEPGNLYHWTLGKPLQFVVTLHPSDPLTSPFAAAQQSRVTADGGVLAFVSTKALDPAHPEAEGTQEIYRYEAATGQIACASCGAPGSTPAEATITAPFYAGGAGGNVLSSDGRRVFFQTAAALVPQDVNGRIDVYEWENGEDHLISLGAGKSDSKLLDASESGDDVFFSTRDRLVSSDNDENIDIYDAKVGGGLAGPPTVGPPCEAEACRPPLEAAPTAPRLSSRSFNGPPNPKRRHQKKHTKHQKKHHHKKHGQKKKSAKQKHGRQSQQRGTTGKRG